MSNYKQSRKLTSEGVFALTELANTGAAKVTAAFSKLIKQKITVKAVGVRLVTYDEIVEVLPDDVTDVHGVQMMLSGEVDGQILFFFPRQSAYNIAALMSNRSLGTSQTLSTVDESALQEAGNIVAGSFLSAVSDFSSVNMVESVPVQVAGDLRGILDQTKEAFTHGDNSIQAVVFEVASEMGVSAPDAEEVSPEIAIKAYFVLVLDVASMGKVFKALRERRGKGPMTEKK